MHLLAATLIVATTQFFSYGPPLSVAKSHYHSANTAESVHALYESIDFTGIEQPDYEIFERGLSGYQQLEANHKLPTQGMITLIDFRKSSKDKRLWVIDIDNKKVLYNTLVAHGKNSGDLYARKFSNQPESHQSSLGFYVTGNTYIGKHGLSLKLLGVEKGINDQAEVRAIVMHGADYVSDSFIQKVGRLGRSFGCPAVPAGLHQEIITQIAGGSCLFIYYPDQDYLTSTTLIDHSSKEILITSGSF